MEARPNIILPAKRGSDDLERCLKIGQQVLRLLEKGAERVVIYGHSGKERVQGLKLMEDS